MAYSIASGILEYLNLNSEDVDKDGDIDADDLRRLIENYNKKNEAGYPVQEADLNGDNIIDLYDMTILSKRMK
jgi:hypothetical protein